MTWEMPLDPASTIERLLSLITGANAGVALYDVGQGSCQAVVGTSPWRVPSLYVDFGGRVLGNAKTFPAAYHGFCFSTSPAVILSHWDWDHWSSAYRFPSALAMEWIAPEVPPKPIQLAFAADLYTRGHLHIWNKVGPSELRTGGVRLERCTGRTANDSGIAVSVFPNKRSKKSCLLPGDADYRHIPSVQAGRAFDAICITHHGGRLHSAVIPKAKRRRAKCACSVGAGNSYHHHPFLETYEAHSEAGWPMPLTTGFTGRRPSHVFLPWEDNPRVFTGRCLSNGIPKCSVALP